MRNELYDRFTDGTRESERWTNNSVILEYYQRVHKDRVDHNLIEYSVICNESNNHKCDGVKFTEDKHER